MSPSVSSISLSGKVRTVWMYKLFSTFNFKDFIYFSLLILLIIIIIIHNSHRCNSTQPWFGIFSYVPLFMTPSKCVCVWMEMSVIPKWFMPRFCQTPWIKAESLDLSVLFQMDIVLHYILNKLVHLIFHIEVIFESFESSPSLQFKTTDLLY